MGRKWSSIAARKSAWLPSNPTRLPSSSNWAAIAGASWWFQAMRICSYKRRIGWSGEVVSVLDIQNTSFLSYLVLARAHSCFLQLQFSGFTIGPYSKRPTMELLRVAAHPVLLAPLVHTPH